MARASARPRSKKLQVILDEIKEAEIPGYQLTIQEMAREILQARTDLALTEDQVRLALVVTDPRVPRIVTTICEIAGVSRDTYYRLRQNPKWIEFQNSLARRLTDTELPTALSSLMALVKTGDAKAIRLFFELRGDLVIRTENTNVTETHEQRLARQRAQARLGGDQDSNEPPAQSG